MTLRLLWPVLALAAVLGLAHALATPTFWPVDETSHVAYADHLVTSLTLPELDTPIPRDLDYPGLGQRLTWERDQGREGRQDIWTSNHPPLPYLVQGVALRVGGAMAGGDGAILLARLTSIAWLVAGVWLTAQLAFLLAPRPPEVAVSRRRGGRPAVAHSPRLRMPSPAGVALAAALIVATTPTLSHLSGLVFNDVPAFTLSTACLLAGVRIAMTGVDTRRLLVLGALCGAAGLTRVSCLPAIAVAGLLLIYGGWRHGIGIPRGRRALALVGAALPSVPAAAFWIRNIVLYGDVTASATLLEKFRRDLNDPIGELLPDPAFWARLWNRMLGDLTTGHWSVGTRAQISGSLLLVVLLAVAVTLWRMRPHGRPRHWLGNPRAVAWVLCLLLPAALLVSTIQFHSSGGSLHGRYMLGGHAVMATGLVVVLAQLPRVGRLVGLLVPAVLLLLNAFLLQALTLHHSLTWTRRSVSMVLPQLPGPATDTVLMVCIAAAAGLLTLALLQHHVPARAPADPPEDDGRPRGRPGRYGAAPSRRTIKESAAA